MDKREWIGVDLDKTLAYYQSGQYKSGEIGPPVKPMLERVRRWIFEGRRVKIFTARVASCNSEEEYVALVGAIQQWCLNAGLPALEVTCIKDHLMMELYDDRAVTVEANTGEILGVSSCGLA